MPIVPDARGRYHSLALPGFWLDPAWLRREVLPKPLAIMQRIAPDALRAALAGPEAERDEPGGGRARQLPRRAVGMQGFQQGTWWVREEIGKVKR